jgi:outer membrane protein OmpA-like peptidoglycan-associated protein
MNTRTINAIVAWTLFAVMPAAATAQGTEQGQAIASSDVLSQISMFSYREGPKSDLYFRGTPIAENAEGTGKVEYQDGNAQISAQVKDLPEPASLGPYTTYVLWALTPDGRASNQGVLVGFEGGKGKLDTQYGAPQFALVVTAEPHFAVTVPSTMIALYNIADDVEGDESKVETLTERADYSDLAPIAMDRDMNVVEMVQARYALAIARAAGAERFAGDTLATANASLVAAETALQGKRSERKTAPRLASEAIVGAEDARRAAMIGSAAAAESESRRVAAATATDSANAAAARAATAAAAVNQRDREATALRTERDRETAALRASAAAAIAARNDLLARLNTALPTHESDRGLVSEIGGVNFATGTANLNVAAREGLAKFSGVVASYPTLQFEVEGHTDSTGSVATNNELSLRRAIAARDYLIGQGVSASSIDVAGFGQAQPVGDNSTSDGRARNRRVEIVISGGTLDLR